MLHAEWLYYVVYVEPKVLKTVYYVVDDRHSIWKRDRNDLTCWIVFAFVCIIIILAMWRTNPC